MPCNNASLFRKAPCTEIEKITHEFGAIGDVFQWQKPGRNRAYLWQAPPLLTFRVFQKDGKFFSISGLRQDQSRQEAQILMKEKNVRNPEKAIPGRKILTEFPWSGVIYNKNGNNKPPLMMSHFIHHHAPQSTNSISCSLIGGTLNINRVTFAAG